MLAKIIAIDVIAAAVIIVGWYLWFLQVNRRRAARVLKWIERAFEGRGQIAGVQWAGSSTLQVRARVAPNVFRQTKLKIQLLPRQTPFTWLWAWITRRGETFTFEADLDYPPAFNLEVNNHRWCGRTRRRFPRNSEDWVLERTAPFVITTRNDWQREIMNMMNSLVASRECDCMRVSFSRTSPHFSATVPLETISPDSHSETNIFEVMRELAAGASASRF
jgi:hypothetical protein